MLICLMLAGTHCRSYNCQQATMQPLSYTLLVCQNDAVQQGHYERDRGRESSCASTYTPSILVGHLCYVVPQQGTALAASSIHHQHPSIARLFKGLTAAPLSHAADKGWPTRSLFNQAVLIAFTRVSCIRGHRAIPPLLYMHNFKQLQTCVTLQGLLTYAAAATALCHDEIKLAAASHLAD